MFEPTTLRTGLNTVAEYKIDADLSYKFRFHPIGYKSIVLDTEGFDKEGLRDLVRHSILNSNRVQKNDH